jgi:hypothetical protein
VTIRDQSVTNHRLGPDGHLVIILDVDPAALTATEAAVIERIRAAVSELEGSARVSGRLAAIPRASITPASRPGLDRRG